MFNNPNLADIFAGAPDYTEGDAAADQPVEGEEVVDQPAEDVPDAHEGEEYEEDVEDEQPEEEYEEEEAEPFNLNDFMGGFNQLLNPQAQQPVNPYAQQLQQMQMQQQQNPYGLQQPQQPQYMLDHIQQMQEQQEAQMRQVQLQSEVATLAQTDSDFQLVAEDFMGVVSEASDLLNLEGGVAMAYEVAKARFVMNNLDNIVQNAVNEYKQAEARKRAVQAPKVTKSVPQKVTAEQYQTDLILASSPKRLFG